MSLNLSPIDTLANAAKDFLQKVVTPPLEEVGGLVADRIKFWRFKNQINILTKAEKYLQDKNLKTRKVSLKMLTPFLEEASLEEDPNLQEKWAALLANTVAENSTINTTIFSHILSQLTINDAKIFESVFAICTTTQKTEKSKYVLNNYNLLSSDFFLKQEPSAEIIIDNLIRLRLVKEIGHYQVPGKIDFTISDLGIRFMEVVTE